MFGDPSELAFEINYGNVAAVISEDRMITESNDVSLRRKAHMADAAVGAIKHLAYGELQGLLAANAANDDELASDMRNVPIANLLQYWSS